jgi:hypothetical protein
VRWSPTNAERLRELRGDGCRTRRCERACIQRADILPAQPAYERHYFPHGCLRTILSLWQHRWTRIDEETYALPPLLLSCSARLHLLSRKALLFGRHALWQRTNWDVMLVRSPSSCENAWVASTLARQTLHPDGLPLPAPVKMAIHHHSFHTSAQFSTHNIQETPHKLN